MGNKPTRNNGQEDSFSSDRAAELPSRQQFLANVQDYLVQMPRPAPTVTSSKPADEEVLFLEPKEPTITTIQLVPTHRLYEYGRWYHEDRKLTFGGKYHVPHLPIEYHGSVPIIEYENGLPKKIRGMKLNLLGASLAARTGSPVFEFSIDKLTVEAHTSTSGKKKPYMYTLNVQGHGCCPEDQLLSPEHGTESLVLHFSPLVDVDNDLASVTQKIKGSAQEVQTRDPTTKRSQRRARTRPLNPMQKWRVFEKQMNKKRYYWCEEDGWYKQSNKSILKPGVDGQVFRLGEEDHYRYRD